MPYDNIDENQLVVFLSPWYEARDLRRAVMEVSQIDYSKVAERKRARDIFTRLETDVPFSEDKRFPPNVLYVYQDDGDWNAKFQQLYSSLEYVEGDKDQKKPGNTHKPAPTAGDVELEKPWSYNDASQQFRNVIRLMANQIARMQGVYGRKSFEARFGWLWSDIQDALELRDHVKGVIKPDQMLIGDTTARSATGVWPGVAHTIPFDGDLEDLSLDGWVYLWSRQRVANHRVRIGFVIASGRYTPLETLVEPTAD